MIYGNKFAGEKQEKVCLEKNEVFRKRNLKKIGKNLVRKLMPFQKTEL